VTATGCNSFMTGSTSVVIDGLPTPYPVSGGAPYCAGGAGSDVQLAFSTTGVNYQLYLGTTPVGVLMPGTGGAVDFGNQTLAGIYTVKGTNATTGCVNTMTGSATVSIDPLPTAYAVLGGGSYCPGGTGVNVDLANSDPTTNYQLYVDGVATGPLMTGTGAGFSFGPQIPAGTYTVQATGATGCVNMMSGSTTVSLYPLPAAYTISAGGSYCSGGSGVAITMSPSDAGILYQLTSGASPIGLAIPGSGGTLNFGLQTAAGNYNVTATDALTGCTNTMNGTAVVAINPLPLSQTLTGGGSYCTGGTGVDVALGSSEAGVNYQLYQGTTPIGLPISGTGVGIDFGLYTTAGIYTIVGTYTGTLCSAAMSGADTITISPLPTAYTITGGGHYCSGGAGVAVGLSNSQIGVNYQLYNGTTPSGPLVAGTGSAITFGPQTAAGVYSVRATNGATTCNNNMTGTVSVVIDPLPTVYNVTGGGGYCVGGAGVRVGLSGSSTGIRYQLWNGITSVGTPLAGTRCT